MSMPDRQTYEEFIYSLTERHPSIVRSTLVLATIGPTLARVEGRVTLPGGVVLDVREFIDFAAGVIRSDSYEVYRADEKAAWYDPWEHPHIPELASTHPHHKHVPPDIKHNRVPAPGIAFDHPNLPVLIEEIGREVSAETAPEETA